MKANIYRSLAHIYVLRETLDQHEELLSLAVRGGYSSALHAQSEGLLHQGEEAIAEILEELQTDTTVMHLVHGCSTELELWLEHVAFRVRRLDAATLALLKGEDLHHHDHTVTVIARTLRLLAMMRNDPALRAPLGRGRAVEDVLQRGNTLLTKLDRLTHGAVNPRDRLGDAQQLLDPLLNAAAAWLDKASASAQQGLAGEGLKLGMLGLIAPEGAPLGGSASSVIRHERTSREAPFPEPSPPDPGWSCGRQGRNNRNVGQGF